MKMCIDILFNFVDSTKSTDRQTSESAKKRTVSVEEQENFNQLIQTAKLYLDEGRLAGALELYKEAFQIYGSDKLAKKIAKIEVGDNVVRRST